MDWGISFLSSVDHLRAQIDFEVPVPVKCQLLRELGFEEVLTEETAAGRRAAACLFIHAALQRVEMRIKMYCNSNLSGIAILQLLQTPCEVFLKYSAVLMAVLQSEEYL